MQPSAVSLSKATSATDLEAFADRQRTHSSISATKNGVAHDRRLTMRQRDRRRTTRRRRGHRRRHRRRHRDPLGDPFRDDNLHFAGSRNSLDVANLLAAAGPPC